MKVDLTAKLKDFDAFEREFSDGDEKREFAGTPLIFAALSNNKPEARYRIARFLLDRGATVAGQNSDGDGALAIVLSRASQDAAQTTELVRLLVQAGADPAQPNNKGVTPTQWIAQLPAPDDEIRPLLETWFALPGLNPDEPNAFGKSPLDLAGDAPERSDRVRRMKEYRA